MGALLLGQPQKKDITGYSYQVNFTSFTFNPAILQASVGGAQSQLQLLVDNATRVTQLRILMSSTDVWQGRPWADVGVQLLGSRNQTVVVSDNLDVDIYENRSNISSSCTIRMHESFCLARIHFADSSFDGSSVSLVARAREPHAVTSNTNVTLRPEPLGSVENVMLVLQRNHVFPGEIAKLSVRANYRRSVAGFVVTCDSNEQLSAESDGSFSVLSAQRTGGIGVDINGLQATRRSNPKNTSEVLFLLNVNVSESSNPSINVTCQFQSIVLQNLEKVVTKATSLSRTATISVSQNAVAGIVAHAPWYSLFNTAALNGKMVSLPLWTTILYRDGTVDSSCVTCSSSNSSVLKVEPNCSSVFLNGTETPGQASINISAGSSHQVLDFDVWGPMSYNLTVDDSTLNRIEDCNMDEFQETRIRATASISNRPTCSAETCITVDVSHLLTFSSGDDSIARVDTERVGVIKGVGEGETTITVINSTLPEMSVPMEVSDQPVMATCLHVFVVSGIKLTASNLSELGPGGVLTADLMVAQELPYADSRAEVIAVVVFNDTSRLVVNTDSRWNMTVLNSTFYHRKGPYIFPVQQGQATVKADAYCADSSEVVQGSINLNISLAEAHNLSIVPVLGDRSYIVHDSDPSSNMFGSLQLKVLLQYDNYTADVTELAHAQDQVQHSSPLVVGLWLNGTYRVTTNRSDLGQYEVNVSYNGYEAQKTVNVVRTTDIDVVFRPYPKYLGSQSVSISTLHAVNGVFPKLLLEASAILSNDVSTILSSSDYYVNASGLNVNTTLRSDVRVLEVEDNTSSQEVVVTVHFGSATGNAALHLRDTPPTVTEVNNAIVSEIDGTFYVDCELKFEDGRRVFSLYDSSHKPLFVHLVSFEDVVPNGFVSINSTTGELQVKQNYHLPLNITVSAENGNLSDNTSFNANLLPGNQEIDLGDVNGLPLAPTKNGCCFEVPVVLNAGVEKVGVIEAELYYNISSVEFVEAMRGQSWNVGSLYYNNDTDNNVVKFGGILIGGVSGTVEVAKMRFRAKQEGQAAFLGKVLYTARAEFSADLTIKEDVESPAANVRVLVKSSSRRRRQAPREVLGDVTGDGVADLRDTVMLQYYTLAEVSDFRSDLGIDVNNTLMNASLMNLTFAATINATDLDGDNVITVADLVSSERLSEGSINIVRNISVSPLNGDSCTNMSISGCVESSSGDEASISTAVVFVHISNSNTSFQEPFDGVRWQGGVVISNHSSDQGLAGGIIQADLNGRTCFEVSATTVWEDVIVDVVIFHGINESEASLEVLEGGGSKDIPAFSTDVQFTVGGNSRLAFNNGLAPLRQITCPIIPSTSTSSVAVTPSPSVVFSSSSEVSSTPPVSTTLPSTSSLSSVISEVSSTPPLSTTSPSTSSLSSVISEVSSTLPVLSSTFEISSMSPVSSSSSSSTSSTSSSGIDEPLSESVSPSLSTSNSITPISTPPTSTPPTSTLPTNTPPTSGQGTMSTVIGAVAAVLGVVIVVIAGIIIVLVTCCCCRRMKKEDKYDIQQVRLNSHAMNGKDFWYKTEEQIVSFARSNRCAVLCPCMLNTVHVTRVIHVRVHLSLLESVPACK